MDIWHCDAMGVYSGVEDPGFKTVGQTFLRGYQLTDDAGEARFRTIYPGWYPGRAVHIHFKIRTDPGSARGHEFISQLYFDEALTGRVYSRMPYAGRTGKPDRNADDEIFARGGDQLLLAPKSVGRRVCGAIRGRPPAHLTAGPTGKESPMTTMQRYAAAAGLVLAIACGDSGVERAAAQAGPRPPPAPVDPCALLTQEEAAAILGTPVGGTRRRRRAARAPTRRQSGQGDDIMIHMMPLTFGSEEEFHAFIVEDTEKMNARMKKELGDAVKPTTVDPAPEVGKPAYYVDPTLVILKDGRVLSIVAADRKQAVAVAAKAVPRF